ncbi:putative ATP-binding protein involved in virulence [Pseudomonas sp. 29]|uniref:ATP-binding protein n=1 Tax=Pseudomonas sp. 29 TaxID=2035197 RepID=UPI000C5F228A|nr:ATP-binding protein [Pseudomonas sp. 29]PIF52579.1 putative ATP-binding protein involved in virulence [Pseudomonas sp. 29]
MMIESLHAVDLHGYITGVTLLKPDLNIIFGKNGSGKTTALNVMRAILNFDTDYIQSLKFSELKLTYFDENTKGTISIKKTKDEHIVKVNDISASLSSISMILREDKGNVLRSFIESWNLDKKKGKPLGDAIAVKEAIDEIKKKTSITLVNIDRTIKVTASSGDISYENAWQLTKPMDSPLAEKTPLDVVQSYCVKNHRELTRNLASIKTEFINGLMVKFLDLRANEFGRDKANVTIDDISRLEQRLRELDIYRDQGPAKVLDKFFKDTKKIFAAQSSDILEKKKAGRRTAKEERDIIIKNISFARIESLLTSIQEMDEKIEARSARIKKYLEVVNSFFSSSEKEIVFSKSDSQLRFKFLSASENFESQESSINELSSGERQIIIVLSYLYFVAKNDSIFIIDEPELSLHLAWQKKFVGAMMELAPVNCQIILASHSPEIIGPYRSTVARVFSNQASEQSI